jgi:hypothetical protein
MSFWYWAILGGCLFSYAQTSVRYSNDYEAVVDIISEEYEAGPWLIYDCKKGHWVCVLETYSKICDEKREREKANANLQTFSCASIASFANKKSCFQRQLFLTTHHHGTRFCRKDI